MVTVTARAPGTNIVWDEEQHVVGSGGGVIQMFAQKHQDVDIFSEDDRGRTLIQQYRGGILESLGTLNYLLIVDDVDLLPVYRIFKCLDNACLGARREIDDYVASHPLIPVHKDCTNLDSLSGRPFFALSDDNKFHVEVREVSVPL
jgi:hypothetical protein